MRPHAFVAAAALLTLTACGGDADTSSPSLEDVTVDSTVGSDDGSDADDPTADAAADTANTTEGTAASAGGAASCDDIAAGFATSGSANADLADPEVSASCDGDSVAITSNGIPDYTYIETSPGSPDAVDLAFTIPASPSRAAEVTAVPLLGTAAVAVNGLPIYGPTEGTGGDVLSLEGALSECGSHNGPTGFHIHMFGTSDSTDCMFTADEVAAAPQLLGYAFDGYPIYTGNDQHTSSWQLIDESLFATDTWAAHTYIEGLGDLDQCNGLTDADGNYAYYTTDTFPYVLGCYSGVVDLEASGAGGGDGGPPGG